MACEKCGGTGKLGYEVEHLPSSWTGADGETYTATGTTYGTRACPCVKDLPAVEGEATWWESESLYHRVLADGALFRDDVFEVSISAEVPRGEDGRRRVSLGNRYYGTSIDLSGPESTTFMPWQLREFIRELERACEIAERHDRKDADVCGHWFPCECVNRAVAAAVAPVVGARPTRNQWGDVTYALPRDPRPEGER